MGISRAWFACVAFLLAGVAVASGDIFPRAGVGEYAAIVGKAAFVKRTTLVPMIICDKKPCPENQTYWALQLEAADKFYELDQKFNLGSEAIPSELEIQNAVVKEGNIVSLEARIDTELDRIVYISDAKSVTILGPGEPPAPSYFGWSCEGDPDHGPGFLATVWNLGFESRGLSNSYRIRVRSSDDGSTLVAETHNAKAQLVGEQIVYRGATSRALEARMIELAIDLRAGQENPEGLPAGHRAVLKVARSISEVWCWPVRVPVDPDLGLRP